MKERARKRDERSRKRDEKASRQEGGSDVGRETGRESL